MKVNELLAAVRDMKATTQSDGALIRYLNEIEGMAQTEVLNIDPVDVVEYGVEDGEVELLIGKPHSKLYLYYLMAMVDFGDGEYKKYQNGMQMANAAFSEWAKWWQRTHGSGCNCKHTVYLSAYGIAVKHGYTGTEAEWLASLKGEKGDTGRNFVVIGRYESLAALKAAVPNPEYGDHYYVGTANPCDVYCYDEATGDWLNTGKLQGPEGEPGEPGAPGDPGRDGVSPTATVVAITGGYRVTITDANGSKSFDLLHGQDGQDGVDGVSPTVTVSDITDGKRITISDANGSKSFDVYNAVGDFAVNNPNTRGYIKNRTHWVNNIDYEVFKTQELVGETTYVQQEKLGLVPDKEYTVIRDQEEYQCRASIYVDGGGTGTQLVSTDGSQLPFFVLDYSDESAESAGYAGVIIPRRDTGSSEMVVFGIIGHDLVYHPLDKNYLPFNIDDYVTEDELEAKGYLTEIPEGSQGGGGVGKNVAGETYDIDGEEVTARDGAEVFNDYATNIATGLYSHAEGSETKATGIVAHTEGLMTQATGEASHAEGAETVASEYASHAEGDGSRAYARGAHAEGVTTYATEMGAHSEGMETEANGRASHAEGIDTIAASMAQHVQGQYNIEDAERRYAHIVGNGEDADHRSNAHTLDWEGNAWYAGDVEGKSMILLSSTEGSTKRFRITVDDSGTLSASEVTE